MTMWSEGPGDIKLLIFHVTQHDHVIREACDILSEFP